MVVEIIMTYATRTHKTPTHAQIYHPAFPHYTHQHAHTHTHPQPYPTTTHTHTGFPAVGADFNGAQAVVVEIIMTFALVNNVLNVACVEAVKDNSYYGIAIGMTVTAGAVAVGGQ